MPLARARGGASQEGLVSLLGAERMRSHCVVAVAMGPALRAGSPAPLLPGNSQTGTRRRQWNPVLVLFPASETAITGRYR
jgi:hypothetical protein